MILSMAQVQRRLLGARFSHHPPWETSNWRSTTGEECQRSRSSEPRDCYRNRARRFYQVNTSFLAGMSTFTSLGTRPGKRRSGGGGEGEGMRILVLTENAFFVSSLIYSLRPQCNKNDQKHGGGVEDSGPILFSLFAERSFSCCRIPFVYFCRQGLVNSSIASSFFFLLQ